MGREARRREIFAALEAGRPIPPLPPVEPLDLGDPNRLMETREIAALLGVSRPCVYQWRERGFLAIAVNQAGRELRTDRGWPLFRAGDVARAEAVTRGRSGRPRPSIDPGNRRCA